MNELDIFHQIDTFIFDVDGVLTDGKVLVQENGQLLRTMHTRDGFAMRRAADAGYRLIIISGGKSEGVRLRLQGLGVEQVHLGIQDKMACYLEVRDTLNLDESNILYMGDDLPDYDVMRKVGLPCAPADADAAILQIAQYISPLRGGDGCVRDVIEKTMKIQGKW